MRVSSALFAGIIFGLGLITSGMANPAKVLNFLDLAGPWDPSLAFVMGGAVIVSFFGFRIAWAYKSPVFGDRFALLGTSTIDTPLVLGAVLFGIGWGIGGYCPGPALAALALLSPGTIVFVVAMMCGLWIGSVLKVRAASNS